jgi:hypothetical protein
MKKTRRSIPVPKVNVLPHRKREEQLEIQRLALAKRLGFLEAQAPNSGKFNNVNKLLTRFFRNASLAEREKILAIASQMIGILEAGLPLI